MTDKLSPCPFCGSSAHIERVGDRRQSTIYQCDNCSCSLETGEEWDHGRIWNQRAENPASVPLPALDPGARFCNRVNGWICSIVSEEDDMVTFLYDKHKAPHCLGRAEFDCRFSAWVDTPAPQHHLVGVASAAEPDRISELSSDRVAERPKAEREQISARPSSCSCWGRIPDSSGRRGFETLPRSDDSLPAIPPPPEPHLMGEIGDLRDQHASLVARGIDPNLDHIPDRVVTGRWLPIEQADKAITDVQEFAEVGMTIKTSDRYWVRDDDGRVYEAAWSEGNNGRDFWWDFEGESPVDPVEFMPHPLDPRWPALASEGQA